MAETAALLVEHRLPAVPWRQWVLSFPGPLAVRLGYDRTLLGRVCQRFATRVMQTLRRLTKRAHGLTSSAALHPGVFIVVQSFRNDLGLFVHLHALVTDGCFDASDEHEPRFLPIAGLTDEHLVHTLQRMHADFAALDVDRDDDGDQGVDAAMAACVQLALPLRATASSPREPAPDSPLLVTAACRCMPKCPRRALGGDGHDGGALAGPIVPTGEFAHISHGDDPCTQPAATHPSW